MSTELLKTVKLTVELFVSSAVQDAASDLCKLADRTGVLCEADFNGVKLWAWPGGNPEKLAREYAAQIKLPSGTYRVAQT